MASRFSIARARAMRDAGMTRAEAAAEFGMTRAAFYTAIHRVGGLTGWKRKLGPETKMKLAAQLRAVAHLGAAASAKIRCAPARLSHEDYAAFVTYRRAGCSVSGALEKVRNKEEAVHA